MVMSSYVRLTKGLADKGRLIKPEEIYNYVESDKDYYVSTYYYNQNHYEQFKKTGSVRGIKDVTTNKLWFDFDNKDNQEESKKDAVVVCDRLIQYGVKEKDIEIYFSGNKGFNVVVTLNRSLTPIQAESLAVRKFGKGLQTLDVSLYDASQVMRVPGTQHPTSGLYKIPLSFKELKKLPVADIKTKAKSLDNVSEEFQWEAASVNDDFMFVEEKVEVKEKPLAPVKTDAPRHWKDYKWQILQGNFEIGERHSALMVLAATCRGLGYDIDTATAMLQTADKKHCERTGDKPSDDLESNIIPSVYSEFWSGGQYSPDNNPWLKKYCERLGIDFKKDDEDKPKQIIDITDGFVDFVTNIDKNTIKTGLKDLDDRMPLTIGMNLGIVGAASSGKTSVALDILENTSKNGVVSVFASLDMHRLRLFEKLLYRVSGGMDRKVIYEAFTGNGDNALTKKVGERFKNVFFYDRSSPSISDIKKYIEKVNEQIAPNKVKVLVLDYFERVGSDRSDETAASKDVSGQIQDLINDLNICCITLVQPNKFSLSSGPDTPILSYTAIKGSSFLYQSFRGIISIWRPFFNPKTRDKDKYMQMAILKNDLGELDIFDYRFEGKTGTIRPLFPEERDEFEALLKEKEESKDGKKEEWS